MNEKLQYATMLEIPVSTCSVTKKPLKKRKLRRKKDVEHDKVKEQLLLKVNSLAEQDVQMPRDEQQPSAPEFDVSVQEEQYGKEEFFEQTDNILDQTPSIEQQTEQKKKGFSIIGVQLAVVGALIAVIFLTNALYANSGINVFLRSVFGSEQAEIVDERVYSDFAPVIAMGNNENLAIDSGVISFAGEGSLYAPCDGTVSAMTLGEDGKYTIEITHSPQFKTVFTGVDYAYVGLDDQVYFNIPVGYLDADGATMCFMNGQTVIADYEVVDNAVIWAV